MPAISSPDQRLSSPCQSPRCRQQRTLRRVLVAASMEWPQRWAWIKDSVAIELPVERIKAGLIGERKSRLGTASEQADVGFPNPSVGFPSPSHDNLEASHGA
uniref:Uncharacterized protein n=1 Tax=Oryza rufipogon TaxID=4529 RepID=A0A0E0PK14_ORYRU